METTIAVFDAVRPVTVNLQTPYGMKTIRVRFLTDEEWIDRQQKCKVIAKQLGHGVSETTIPDSQDVDGALLQHSGSPGRRRNGSTTSLPLIPNKFGKLTTTSRRFWVFT